MGRCAEWQIPDKGTLVAATALMAIYTIKNYRIAGKCSGFPGISAKGDLLPFTTANLKEPNDRRINKSN
jgi:hypothetical protein